MTEKIMKVLRFIHGFRYMEMALIGIVGFIAYDDPAWMAVCMIAFVGSDIDEGHVLRKKVIDKKLEIHMLHDSIAMINIAYEEQMKKISMLRNENEKIKMASIDMDKHNSNTFRKQNERIAELERDLNAMH